MRVTVGAFPYTTVDYQSVSADDTVRRSKDGRSYGRRCHRSDADAGRDGCGGRRGAGLLAYLSKKEADERRVRLLSWEQAEEKATSKA